MSFSGATGPLRLFDELMGGQASWLLPAAMIALLAGLWARRRAPRTDRARAALLLWGGWLIVTAAVFSFSSGVIHTYYTVALAPAIAALVAIGGALLWPRRNELAARALAAFAVAASAGWAYALLDRTPSWEPWLRPMIAVLAVLAVIGLLAGPALGTLGRRVSTLAAVLGVAAALAGPTAYAAQTITTAHTGSIPSAGPASASSGGFGGGFPGGGGAGFRPGGRPTGTGSGAGAPPSEGRGSAASSLFGNGTPPSGKAARGGTTGGRFSGGAGGMDVTVSSALAKALETDAGKYRWVAATSGSQSAASIELATGGEPVMAIGGFNNEGGKLTLAEFERYVEKGDIHYYIASGGGGGPGGADATESISTWVKAHFKSVTIGGQTVYDLTAAS